MFDYFLSDTRSLFFWYLKFVAKNVGKRQTLCYSRWNYWPWCWKVTSRSQLFCFRPKLSLRQLRRQQIMTHMLGFLNPVGDLDAVPAFWLPPGPSLTAVILWRVKQQMEVLSLSLFSLSLRLSNKSHVSKMWAMNSTGCYAIVINTRSNLEVIKSAWSNKICRMRSQNLVTYSKMNS